MMMGPMQRETTIGVAVSVVLVLAAVGYAVRRAPPTPPPVSTASVAPSAAPLPPAVDALGALKLDATPLDWNRPIATGRTREAGYVGSARCAECHQAIATKYERHSMARTGIRVIGPAERASLRKGFDAGQTVKHPTSGFLYRPYRQGERLFIEERLNGPDGQTALHTFSREVTHTFASDTFGRALGYRIGGFVYQFPIDWYPGAAKWSLDPGFKSGGRFERPLAAQCIACHTEAPEHLQGSFDAVTDPAPGGVGCERCHGPGKKHSESLLPADVVNPRALPVTRQVGLCAQCHLQGIAEILRAGRTIYSARPDEPLHAYRMNYVQAEPSTNWFQLTAQSDRMVRSACFKKSAGKLVCTTCHDPHGTSVGVPAATWRKACLGCHSESSCKMDSATRHAALDNCPSCHMRKDTPGDFRMQVPDVALPTTDHWIRARIDPPTNPTAKVHPPKLTAVVPFASLIGESATGPELFAIEAVGLQLAGRPDALLRLVAATQHGTKLPEVYDEIARVLSSGRAQTPEDYEQWRLLRAAIVRLWPDDVTALIDYAKVCVLTNPPMVGEATAALDRALRVYPEHPGALLEKGVLLFRLGKREEAIEVLDHATTAGPDALEAYVALALTARDANNHAVAIRNLQHARICDPTDRWLAEQLMGAHAAAGDGLAAGAMAKIAPMLAEGPPSKRVQRLLTPLK